MRRVASASLLLLVAAGCSDVTSQSGLGEPLTDQPPIRLNDVSLRPWEIRNLELMK